MSVRASLLCLLALTGCGAQHPAAGPPQPPPADARGAAPIGYQPAAPARAPSESCAARGPSHWMHLELFAHGKVVVVPAGIGIAEPRTTDGAYVKGACRFETWTEEPTGLVAVARDGLTLGDLFDVWGRELSPTRIARFRGNVRAFVDGRPHAGNPRTIALDPHAQVVLQVGHPAVEPHARYEFPPTR